MKYSQRLLRIVFLAWCLVSSIGNKKHHHGQKSSKWSYLKEKNIKKFNATQENSFALIPRHQNRLKVKHEKCDAVSKAVIVSNGVELVKARKQQIGNQGNQKHACIGGEKLEYSKPS